MSFRNRQPTIKSNNLSIPLSQIPRTRSFHRKVIAKAHLLANKFSPSKPGRYLGAPWMDQYVARRMPVSVCEVCSRMYGSALSMPKYGYRIDLHPGGRKLGVCDGCAAGSDDNPVDLIPYYPQEKYEDLRLKTRNLHPFIGA